MIVDVRSGVEEFDTVYSGVLVDLGNLDQWIEHVRFEAARIGMDEAPLEFRVREVKSMRAGSGLTQS